MNTMNTQNRVYSPLPKYAALLQRIAERGQKEQGILIQTAPKKVTREYKGRWRMYVQALRRQRESLMDRLYDTLY